MSVDGINLPSGGSGSSGSVSASAPEPLADRMKRYEQVTRTVLLPHSYTILRVDGRAFHSYLRDAERPYDMAFIHDMRQVAAELCRQVSGTVFAYGQSDEISLLVSDVEPQSQPWFGGVAQKMASVAAGIATAKLIHQRGPERLPHFDARVFTLPNLAEVTNYFIWRQRDAVRNSISMAAQTKFSAVRLHGKNTDEMQEMLWREHGINWNDYSVDAKRGWVIARSVREADVTYTDKRTGLEQSTTALRTFWEPVWPTPHFTHDVDLFDLAALASPDPVVIGARP